MTDDKLRQSFEAKCQTYQKWFIQLESWRLAKPLILAWITDRTDNDADKLIVDKNNQVVAAYDHRQLIRFFKDNKSILPDSLNTISWTNDIERFEKAYPTIYNIIAIESSLKSNGFSKASVYESINFINLFNDLADQLDDPQLRSLSDKQEVRNLWDFGYNEIFWKEFGEQEELASVSIPQFQTDYNVLSSALSQMIDAFIERLVILDDQEKN
ncbi:hypothetical protein RT717_03820 [Imperialibacter roseus]|uniref:Uncharacterized protein n=1 Tax=Imperialibacter roseus TaxID=1324217 RepID=A0ABZ0IT23_9BACT|nr:hypothetical protein [Imperialibacter roseus]WOK07751.1 hypothetical protein RT717_03820 [Imperialibacter roseus]